MIQYCTFAEDTNATVYSQERRDCQSESFITECSQCEARRAPIYVLKCKITNVTKRKEHAELRKCLTTGVIESFAGHKFPGKLKAVFDKVIMQNVFLLRLINYFDYVFILNLGLLDERRH